MTVVDKITFASLELTLPLVIIAWLAVRRTTFYGKLDAAADLRYDLHNSIFLLLLLVAVSRAFVGIAKYLLARNLWYVSYLYPTRVGGINWHLFNGLPYLAICLLVLWRLDVVLQWMAERRYAGGCLFLFALLFGISFGAITGGLQYGLTNFFHSPDHIHDAELFRWTLSDLNAHDYRRYADHQPHYLASHFMTHPPFLLGIWSFFLQRLSVPWLSLFCALVFAAMIYCVYLAFQKELGTAGALYAAVLFLFTPALLIYGIGGDDVISDALWTATLCLAYLGIRRESAGLFAGGLVALVAAMAVQYSSIVLLPAMFALPSEAKLSELHMYVWRFKYWIVASCGFVALVWWAVFYATGFNYFDDMRAIFVWYRTYDTPYKIMQGEYAFALGSRLMNFGDFFLLGGPAIAFAVYEAFVRLRWQPAQWRVRGCALFVLVVYALVQSLGDGETARGWGGLYAALLFGLTADFYAQRPHDVQRRIMRYQLGWALAAKALVNFGW